MRKQKIIKSEEELKEQKMIEDLKLKSILPYHHTIFNKTFKKQIEYGFCENDH
jgi:hypothetical protein